jgi:hypothetical protein
MTGEEWKDLSEKLADAVESGAAADTTGLSPDLAQFVRAHHAAGDWLEAEPFDPLLGRTLAGRYTFLGVLGRGGAGTVYLASDLADGARKVVKLLHPFWTGDPRMRRNLQQEVAALSRLRHPAIVELVDAGESTEGWLYLVMPYREGRTLRQAMTAGPLTVDDIAAWIRGAGAALEYAHQQGITHRDLKPENILLVRQGDREQPMLLDFGIADIAEGPLSHTTTQVMGSPLYMAPEHLMGRPRRASDTFSLAVIAWEMLCGKHPFDPRTPFALPELHRRGPGDAFFAARPDLSVAAGRQLERALAFDPDNRPDSIRAFADALAAALSRTAGDDDAIQKLWARRPTRRYLITAAAGSALGIAALPFLLANWMDPLRSGERTVAYAGGSEPADMGFRRRLDLRTEVIQEPRRSGYRMERFHTNSQGHAHHTLTDRQKSAAFRRGWRITASMRPEVGYVAAGLSIGPAAPRFDVSLGVVDGRRSAVSTTRIRTGWTGFTIPLDPPPPGQLIDVEIRYDASTRLARVTAAGRLVTDRQPGLLEYRDDVGFNLSTFVDTLAEAHGIIGDARFEIA